MTLLRYNSVIIIEEAQFGISPIKLEIIGANTFPFKNILPINSSFTNPSFLSCQSSEHMSYNLTDGFIPIIFDKTQGKFIQGSG